MKYLLLVLSIILFGCTNLPPSDLNGKGKFTYDNGYTYVGNFKNGLPHGIGIRIERNGEKYDGEWKKGVFWEGTAFDSSDNILGKKVNGNWE